jgi:hypothetical protein
VIEDWFGSIGVCFEIYKLLVEYNHCLLRVETPLSATIV